MPSLVSADPSLLRLSTRSTLPTPNPPPHSPLSPPSLPTTSNPNADICSFCPRDYANELRKTGADFHNKPKKPLLLPNGKKPPTSATQSMHADDFDLEEQFREFIRPDGTVGLRNTRGWYERIEHNGWRPISERILVEEDPITTMTKLKRVPFFHFNPTVRR